MLARLSAFEPAVRAQVLEALGWQDRKQVPIVSIRPPKPLPGGSFSALFHTQMRKQYVEAGRAAAREALAGW